MRYRFRREQPDSLESVVSRLLYAEIKDAESDKAVSDRGWTLVSPSEVSLLQRGLSSRLYELRGRNHARLTLDGYAQTQSLRDQFPSLGQPLEYLHDRKTLVPGDKRKAELARRIVRSLEPNIGKRPQGLRAAVFLGWWRMIESNGVDAPPDRVLVEGFSPRDWIIASTRASTDLSLDVANLDGGSTDVQTAQELIELIESRVRNLEFLPRLDQNTLDRVRRVIEWSRFLQLLPVDLSRALGLSWFGYLIWEDTASIPADPTLCANLTAELEGAVERITGFDERTVSSTIDTLEAQGLPWTGTLLSWPHITP